MADDSHGESKHVGRALLFVGPLLLLWVGISEFAFDEPAKEISFFWVQMFSGSHWPEWKFHGEYPRIVFVLAATLHALITAGPLLGIGYLVYKLMSTRSVSMTVAQVLKSRDRSIMFAIKGVLADVLQPSDKKKVVEKLNAAFDKADLDWKEDLKILVGDKQADEIVKKLESTKIIDAE